MSGEHTFGTRLDDVAHALTIARHTTKESRHYNRARLEKKATAGNIEPGDSVVIKADDRQPLTSRWDPHWEVTRKRGPVLWLRQQQTGRTKVFNREKVRLVDTTITWEDCNTRPPRAIHPEPCPETTSSSR